MANYKPVFDDERIRNMNKIIENLKVNGVRWTADKVRVEFDKTVISGTSGTSKFYTSVLTKEMTLITENEENEMALTEKLESTKLSGVVINDTMITLDKTFNGAKSFKFPKEIDSSVFRINDKVVCTFVGGKCTSVEKLVDFVDETLSNKPKKNRVKLLPDDGFYVTPFQQKVLQAAYKAVSNKIENVIISLVGAAGYGKTSIAEYYARINNLPILIVDCSTISDNQEHFIIPEFKSGETHFALTEFSKFLQMGDCVVVLDEINRMPSWVSNSLLPVTDHRKATHLRGIDIKVASGITFFYTSNMGAEYTGTNPLDRALKGRVMGTMLVDVLPNDVEIELLEKRHNVEYESAVKILDVMNKLRESLKDYPVNVSTRTSLFIAFWVNLGLTIREAVELVVLNDAPLEAQKQVLEAIKLAKV